MIYNACHRVLVAIYINDSHLCNLYERLWGLLAVHATPRDFITANMFILLHHIQTENETKITSEFYYSEFRHDMNMTKRPDIY